jgi:hypothetical protein
LAHYLLRRFGIADKYPKFLNQSTALLTTSVKPSRIQENFELSTIPEDAMREIRGITTSVRFNAVVETGVPGFIRRAG